MLDVLYVTQLQHFYNVSEVSEEAPWVLVRLYKALHTKGTHIYAYDYCLLIRTTSLYLSANTRGTHIHTEDYWAYAVKVCNRQQGNSPCSEVYLARIIQLEGGCSLL